MPPRKSAPKPEQVPAGPPVRVEIRVGGRVQFANECFGPQLVVDGDVVKFIAALEPVLVDAPVERPPERFGDDPRDGEQVIQRVHSGRRDIEE